jgi:hypothetical protein
VRFICELIKNFLALGCGTFAVDTLELFGVKTSDLEIVLNEVKRSCPACENDTAGF